MWTSRTNYGSKVNRKIEIAAGLALTIVGLPFLVLGVTGTWAMVTEGLEGSLYVVTILGVIAGAFGVWIGARMVLGLRRRDGGLLSPFVLRLAALFFAVTPIVLAFASDRFSWRSIWMILELAFSFSVAGSCLVLANRRQQKNLAQNVRIKGQTALTQ